MSRVAKSPIKLPTGVDLNISGSQLSVKGPKGNLALDLHPSISFDENDGEYLVKPDGDKNMAMAGTFRSLVSNMVVGVSDGFNRRLQIEGVGYRAALEVDNLILNVGYSHPVVIEPPEGINFEITDRNGRQLVVSGIDKEVVGEIAARIRRVRPPEPYKGKGIRDEGETIRRKAGKAGKVVG